MPDNTPEYTSPNLMRSIASPDMIDNKKYSVFIAGTNSYRCVDLKTDHNEDSDDNEIP